MCECCCCCCCCCLPTNSQLFRRRRRRNNNASSRAAAAAASSGKFVVFLSMYYTHTHTDIYTLTAVQTCVYRKSNVKYLCNLLCLSCVRFRNYFKYKHARTSSLFPLHPSLSLSLFAFECDFIIYLSNFA